MAELLQWRASDVSLPDADITVLMWVVTGNESDWCGGWWDGQDWHGCDHGGVVAGAVTHWAEPEGPCWRNVEFSGAPAGHSSNHPAGGTSAGTQG